MEVLFIAGFGPIAPDPARTYDFWSGALGVEFEELAPDYHHAKNLPGAKVFGLWPLAQAAEATFGSPEWPADVPVPQAWIELEVASADAVADAAAELRDAGHRILVDAHQEPWGQTTARLMSPEGLLLGLSYMPDFH